MASDHNGLYVREDTGTASLKLWQTPPGGSEAIIPAASLKPDLGLVTSTTAPSVNAAGATDTTTATNGYANPIVGQATSSVVDPAGLNLRSGATYEAQGTTGQYLRQLSSTLPGGFNAAGATVAQPGGGTQAATVTNTYYTATEAGPTGTGAQRWQPTRLGSRRPRRLRPGRHRRDGGDRVRSRA